jgi:hypothetical protein
MFVRPNTGRETRSVAIVEEEVIRVQRKQYLLWDPVFYLVLEAYVLRAPLATVRLVARDDPSPLRRRLDHHLAFNRQLICAYCVISDGRIHTICDTWLRIDMP